MNVLLVVLVAAVLIAPNLYLARAVHRLAIRNDRQRAELDNGQRAAHRRCVNRMIEALGDDREARALRLAAKDWDDPVSQGYLAVLARERYTPGGPSMPSIWMVERADKIEQKSRGRVAPEDGTCCCWHESHGDPCGPCDTAQHHVCERPAAGTA